MITITLEGECWRDILREMSIIEASVRGARIEPDYKKSVCPACGKPASAFDNEEHRWVGMDRKEYCCVDCSIAGPSASRIEAKPDKGIVAPDERSSQDGPKKPFCAYCGEVVGSVYLVGHGGNIFCSPECAEMHTLDPRHYGLGPEERAEILERVR